MCSVVSAVPAFAAQFSVVVVEFADEFLTNYPLAQQKPEA